MDRQLHEARALHARLGLERLPHMHHAELQHIEHRFGQHHQQPRVPYANLDDVLDFIRRDQHQHQQPQSQPQPQFQSEHTDLVLSELLSVYPDACPEAAAAAVRSALAATGDARDAALQRVATDFLERGYKRRVKKYQQMRESSGSAAALTSDGAGPSGIQQQQVGG